MPSRRVLAVSLALGAAALPLWADAAVSRAATPTNQLEQQNCPVAGQDPDTVTFFGPTETMWPPNHKLNDFAVTASETPGEQNNTVKLTVSITEIDTQNGAGNPHTPDWTLNGQSTVPMATATGNMTDTVTIPLQLRAERAGTGVGRTYRIDWMATFDNGIHPCSSSDSGSSTNGTMHHAFVVTVPHDQGH